MTGVSLNVRRRSVFIRVGEDHIINAEEIALVANAPDDSSIITFRDGAPPLTVSTPFREVVKILADWECLR